MKLTNSFYNKIKTTQLVYTHLQQKHLIFNDQKRSRLIMKKTLLLIMNPHAGVMKGKDNLYTICNTLCAADFDVNIRITQSPGHAMSIAREEGTKFEYIVCCGGDGTLHEVVCGMQRIPNESRPLLGYIPAGTTNDFAQNFGLSLNPAESVKRIVDPQIVDIDIGKFGDNEKGDNFFTYTAATGAFTDASYRTPQKTKNAIGYMAYILDGITHLGNIKPIHMRITAGNRVFEDDYIFASVSNSTTVAKMIKIDKIGVDMSDGLFELILIKNPQNLKDADTIAKSLLSPNDPKYGLVRAQASSIKFELDSKTVWTLDGEMAIAQKSFTISCLNKSLKFIK
jgi:lipid kinase, YegS/Rv2252/BmrU family